MRPYVALCAFLAGSIALPVWADNLDFSKSDAATVSIAEQAWASSIAEAREEGAAATTIRALKQDLNGDGTPEVVGLLQNSYLCGATANCLFVLADAGSGYDVIFSTPGVEGVEVLANKSEGWADLKSNGMNLWRYNGYGYSMAP
jgi:hypothetical protein